MLSNIIIRNHIKIRISYINEITKHVIILDFKVLDLEEKRELVSVLVAWAVGMLLGVTVIVPIVVLVFAVIAAVNAFQGKSFKVPGAYHIAAAIIK